MDVLDIGSADGEPGIAIAAAVRPGRVTLLDLAPDLLEIAAARARRDGLDNVDTRQGDAHSLPFGDGSFDRVTSRLVAMYFADCGQAFREALRVLRPRGKTVHLVWGSFDQPMFRDVIGVIFKYVAPPEDEPGAVESLKWSTSCVGSIRLRYDVAVNAVHASILFDASYAPGILIFRFTRWPSLAEQEKLLKSLVEARHLSSHSSGLLDITALTENELPDPDSLASGLAQAAGNNAILNRIACVVASPEQARFVDTLRMMAPQPSKIAVFKTQNEALQWLIERSN